MVTEVNVWENENASFQEILEAWMDLQASLDTPYAYGYSVPVSEMGLRSTEKEFGFKFHSDVWTFYRMSDGFRNGMLLPNSSRGLSLFEATRIWEQWYADDLVFDLYEDGCKCMSPEAAAVARRSPPQNLVPVILHDPEMLLAYAVECSGPLAGAVFGIGDPSRWVAPSLSELFRRAHRFYAEGRCQVVMNSLSLDYDQADEYRSHRLKSGKKLGGREYTDLFLTSDIENSHDLYSWR